MTILKKVYILPLLGLLSLAACNTSSKTKEKTIVSVSIAPQKYFVERLLDDQVDVNVMVPPGSSPATYSPTPSQLIKLSNSKAYLLMGHLGFETTWQDKLKDANASMDWFNLSENIDLIQGDHDHHHHHHDHVCSVGADPHVWTSPKEMLMVANNLKTALIKLMPEQVNLIEDNYLLLEKDILQLDNRLNKLANEKPNLSFMIFHPAYTYLARAYAFEQISIEFEGKTPTPARMKSTIEKAQKKAIKTIFIQQEFDQANADVVAKAIGAKTTQVNPLSENWLLEMEQFISHLENS